MAGHGRLERDVEGVTHRDAPLLHGGRSESGEADHVAGRIDTPDVRLEVRSDGNPALRVEGHARRFQAQALRVAAAPCGEEDLVRREHAPRAEREAKGVGSETRLPADRLDRVAEQDLATHALEGDLEARRKLAVEEGQEPLAALDERHARPEGRENRSVFAADHPTADDRERLRNAVEVQDAVRVLDVGIRERDAAGRQRRRPDRDERGVERQPAGRRAVGVEDADRPAVEESRVAADHLDPVALEVATDLAPLRLRHDLQPAGQLAEALLPVEVKRHPIKLAPPETRQVESGLAQGLGRKGPGVERRAPRVRHPLDDRDALAEIRGLGRPFLSGRTRPDDDEVVTVGRKIHGRHHADLLKKFRSSDQVADPKSADESIDPRGPRS